MKNIFISELINKIKMKNLLVIIVLVICAIVILSLCTQKPEKQWTKISTSEFKNEAKSIKELAVLEQPYKLLVKGNKEKCLLGKHICSSASFSVVCDYTMQIGFKKVPIIDQSDASLEIIVRYPHAEILNPGSRENCHEYEWKNGLWSKMNIEHFNEIKDPLEKEQTEYIKKHFKEYDEAATAQLKKLILGRLTHLARSHNAELIEYPEKEYLRNKIVLDTASTYTVRFEQIQEE